MTSIIKDNSVKRSEIINEETEMMFPDAKVYTDEQRLGKRDFELDYYFFKLGDQRFKINKQIATATYNYIVEIASEKKLSADQLVGIDNVINSILTLKGEKVVNVTKSIEKILRKEYGIHCSIEFLGLKKELSGNFDVKHSAFNDNINVHLVTPEAETIISYEKVNETTI